MATTGPAPFDDTVRPEDDRVEEALAGSGEDEDARVGLDASLPDEADEADVLEQRSEIPADDEEDAREG